MRPSRRPARSTPKQMRSYNLRQPTWHAGLALRRTVTRRKHAHHLDANAETAYNGQRTAEILARVSGVIHEVRVELNQVVNAATYWP